MEQSGVREQSIKVTLDRDKWCAGRPAQRVQVGAGSNVGSTRWVLAGVESSFCLQSRLRVFE